MPRTQPNTQIPPLAFPEQGIAINPGRGVEKVSATIPLFPYDQACTPGERCLCESRRYLVESETLNDIRYPQRLRKPYQMNSSAEAVSFDTLAALRVPHGDYGKNRVTFPCTMMDLITFSMVAIPDVQPMRFASDDKGSDHPTDRPLLSNLKNGQTQILARRWTRSLSIRRPSRSTTSIRHPAMSK